MTHDFLNFHDLPDLYHDQEDRENLLLFFVFPK